MNLNQFKKISTAMLMSSAVVVPFFGSNSAFAQDANQKAAAASTQEKKAIIPGADSTVVGEIDGIKVTLGEVKDLAKDLPKSLQGNFDMVYPVILNQLLYKKILTAKAKASGLEKDKETQKRIAECKEMMLQKAYLDAEIDKLATPDVLRKKYDEFTNQISKEKKASLSFMILKTQDAAKKVIERLQKGEAFAKIAVDESAEETKDGPITADFTKMSLRQIVEDDKDFVEKVFNSKGATNIASPAKVRGKDMWAVFRVENVEPIQPRKFEDIKDELKDLARPQLAKEALKGILKTAKMKMFDQDGKTPLKEPNLDEEMATAPEGK